jgi:RNA polymerase sigma factor (sigma-70 family)
MGRKAKAMEALTPEQSQMMADNFELCQKYSMYWTKKLYTLNFEECYDVCMATLLKGVTTYAEDFDCKFTTYYYVLCERAIFRALRAQKAQKRQGEFERLSLDVKVAAAETEVTIKDKIYTEDKYSFMETDQIQSLLPVLTIKERKAIVEQFLVENPRKQSEIAVDLGCSQVQVSRITKVALEKLYNALMLEEVFS